MTLEEMTIAILVWFPDKLPDEYFRISCWLNQKFLVVSLNYMLGWSIFFISFERMLVECFGYGLFDSRKRSIVISILNFIICPLTTLPGIFTLKQLPTDQINPIINRALLPSSCVNYTPLGATIYSVVSGIHGYGTLVLFVVLCLFVFVHLIKHRYGIAPDDTTRQSIRLILRNHGDFFLPLLVAVVCSLPMIIIAEMMTCTKASQLEALPYLILVFGNILGLLPTGFTFFYYIYPANVYLTAFWTDSPVGRCLRKVKTQWTARN